MTDLVKVLSNTSSVDDYRISSTERQSYELFFVHKKLETVRSTDTNTTQVTVYVNHDEKLGSSDFSVYEYMTEEDVQDKINVAVTRAKLASNQPYNIPSGGYFKEEIPSNFKEYSTQELAQKIADAVFAADDIDGGSINATEIFIYKDTITVKNSRGADKTQIKYHAMVEAIPTWNENGESVELYENYTFTEFDPSAITEEISVKMRAVRDRQHAVKPQTPLVCNVVLNKQEIARLVGSFSRDVNYSNFYSHSNLHNVGDDLQPSDDCDKLTVTMCGALSGSTRSALFDSDAVELGEQVIIENGVVVNGYGNARYAEYLGKEVTGELNCTKVACGTLTNEEIKQEPYLECISLSGLQVNLYSDYIGGEIRLAYYYDGQETHPVTGISMSAKLSDVLSHLRLSEAIVASDGYTGPAKALLKNVTIL